MMKSTFGDTYGVLMRLHEVERWSMVPMRRRQSVAEHSFRVMVIARALYDVLFPINHNSDESKMLDRLALWHDADEFWVGDLPSVVKQAIEAESPGMLERVAAAKFAYASSMYLDVKRGSHGTIVECIVKIADVAEALAYFNEYVVGPSGGNNPPTSQTDVVYKFLEQYLSDSVSKLMRHPLALSAWSSGALWPTLKEITQQPYLVKLMEVRHPGYKSPGAVEPPAHHSV